MASLVHKEVITVYQEFLFLAPQKDVVNIALFDDNHLFLSCDKLKVTIEKGKTSPFVFTGKGSRVQKALIDKSLQLFFNILKEKGIKHGIVYIGVIR